MPSRLVASRLYALKLYACIVRHIKLTTASSLPTSVSMKNGAIDKPTAPTQLISRNNILQFIGGNGSQQVYKTFGRRFLKTGQRDIKTFTDSGN